MEPAKLKNLQYVLSNDKSLHLLNTSPELHKEVINMMLLAEDILLYTQVLQVTYITIYFHWIRQIKKNHDPSQLFRRLSEA